MPLRRMISLLPWRLFTPFCDMLYITTRLCDSASGRRQGDDIYERTISDTLRRDIYHTILSVYGFYFAMFKNSLPPHLYGR